jgi:hypothetical protein
MPVTLTPVGTSLDVVVVDDNFDAVDYAVRRMVPADFAGRFDRATLRRFCGSKIQSFIGGSNPFAFTRDEPLNPVGDLKISYRREDEDSGDKTVAKRRENSFGEFELLGYPGGSMYYSFQEDGLQAPDQIHTSITGWPPQGWPFNKFRKGACYSRWLTVPKASERIWVPERCIADITGSAVGDTQVWGRLRYLSETGRFSSHRFNFSTRIGIIVDTNPVLYPDEFGNGNRWIVDENGNTAPYKTWSVVSDETITTAQRQRFSTSGRISLKGGRFYNFRLAYRQPGHFGWVDVSAAPPAFKYETWENAITSTSMNAPVHSPYFDVWPSSGLNEILVPPWISYFTSSSISATFHYGRAFERADSSHSDFSFFYR